MAILRKSIQKLLYILTKNKNAVTPVDQPYNDMVGPEGQTVYIDKDARYYYIDEKGDRIYVNKSELRDKPR